MTTSFEHFQATEDVVLQPYRDAIRDATEAHWLQWARIFLTEGDIDGAIDALITADYELRAHDNRVAAERSRT